MLIKIKSILKKGVCVLLVAGMACKVAIDMVSKANIEISPISSKELYLGTPPGKGENYISSCNGDGYEVKENMGEAAIDEEMFEGLDYIKFESQYENTMSEPDSIILKLVKGVMGNDIKKFRDQGYSVMCAKVVNFSNLEIFNEYLREEIIGALTWNGRYGSFLSDLKKELRKDIMDGKTTEKDVIKKFVDKGYTIQEMERVGIRNIFIFENCSHSKVMESFADNESQKSTFLRSVKLELDRKIAQDEESIESNIRKFKDKGYTAKESIMARFSFIEVFEEYSREEIIESLGEGEEYKEFLNDVKEDYKYSGNSYNIVKQFRDKGYKANEVNMMGVSCIDILKEYTRNEIIESLGEGDRYIVFLKNISEMYNEGRVKGIVKMFNDKGYTEREKELAGLINDQFEDCKDSDKFEASEIDSIDLLLL